MCFWLGLAIGNSIDHVLTKRAYKPLDSFGCMSIILGTCQDIVQEEADRLWYDGFTVLYFLYLRWPGLVGTSWFLISALIASLNELNIMVEDIDPHIIGITESWANTDITDAELGLTGYIMFRRDRIGRRGGGVILYVKEFIQAYEIKLESEADYDEAVWCKIVSGNSKLTIGLVYRSPNINEADNTKIQNAIKEVSKGECIIVGDCNHGHIQWKSLESKGGDDQQFLFLIQECFLTQHVLEPTRGENVLDIVLSSQKELVDNVKMHEPLGNSDHNQIHFDINVKSESKNKKRIGETSTKVTIKI